MNTAERSTKTEFQTFFTSNREERRLKSQVFFFKKLEEEFSKKGEVWSWAHFEENPKNMILRCGFQTFLLDEESQCKHFLKNKIMKLRL